MSQNPFQSGARKVIPAVLVYARRPGEVLMIHKCDRPGDGWHTGKWNGLGGKCELDESPLLAAKREFHEEAGVDLPIEAFQPLGVLQFPNFKPQKNEDWVVWVFSVELGAHASEVKTRCDEGDLHWIKESELVKLPLWSGDPEFLPYVIRREPFMGTFWYEERKMSRHWIQPL